ncbi:hypothetical protein HaLaN_22744 [Haematococcus lacustris]|uniref:Uncharacterized protein n=1 Tax=Haematococcus lacustris TaxID=44745 RepID=A0A6A0A0N2_HAELA|nr:hypothetical protein HaLaN_22744 [Haematococcus lacustris]
MRLRLPQCNAVVAALPSMLAAGPRAALAPSALAWRSGVEGARLPGVPAEASHERRYGQFRQHATRSWVWPGCGFSGRADSTETGSLDTTPLEDSPAHVQCEGGLARCDDSKPGLHRTLCLQAHTGSLVERCPLTYLVYLGRYLEAIHANKITDGGGSVTHGVRAGRVSGDDNRAYRQGRSRRLTANI